MKLEILEIIVKSVFNIKEIKSKNKQREKVDARKAFVAIAYQNNLESKRKIMHFIGRDHSLFAHYQSEINNLIQTDKLFEMKYNTCVKLFDNGSNAKKNHKLMAGLYLKMHKFHLIEASKLSKETDQLCLNENCTKSGIKKLGMFCNTHYQQNFRDKNPIKAKFASLRKTATRGGHLFSIDYNQFFTFCKEKNYLELKQAEPKIQIKMKEPNLGYISSNLILTLNGAELCEE